MRPCFPTGRLIVAMALLVLALAPAQAQEKDRDKVLDQLARSVANYYDSLYAKRGAIIPAALVSVSYDGADQSDLVTKVKYEFDHFLNERSEKKGARSYQMVDRQRVDQVWDAQKASCGQDVDAACAIELGRNLSANSLLFVTLYKGDDKHWHKLFLKMTDARVNGDEKTWLVDLWYKGEAGHADASPTKTPIYRAPKPDGGWNSPIDLRIGGAYENYFNTYRPSGYLDVLYRNEGAALGLRLGYMPDVIKAAALPYDFGHLVGAQFSDELPAGDQVVFVGSVPLSPGDMAMIDPKGPALSFDSLRSSADDGLKGFEFDRIRMTNIQASRISVHPMFRLYLSKRADVRRQVKLYMDFGLGWDWIRTSARFGVERTRVTQDNGFNYQSTVSTFESDSYEYDGYRKDLLLGTMLFGAGLEYGRLSLAFNWRTVFSTPFEGSYDGYRRIKGDILYMPMLDEEGSTSNAMRLTVEDAGAVNYGKVNIQADAQNKHSGNGVNQFTDRSNLMFMLAIRIL